MWPNITNWSDKSFCQHPPFSSRSLDLFSSTRICTKPHVDMRQLSHCKRHFISVIFMVLEVWWVREKLAEGTTYFLLWIVLDEVFLDEFISELLVQIGSRLDKEHDTVTTEWPNFTGGLKVGYCTNFLFPFSVHETSNMEPVVTYIKWSKWWKVV